MLLLVLFAFLAGIVTTISPCILPILPAILSVGTMGGKWRPLGIIVGLVVSFTFCTLFLTAIVHATGLSPNALRYFAIAVIAFFGLVMLVPGLSNWFARITTPLATIGEKAQSSGARGGFGSGLIFGSALGLLWTPCAGPILAAIIALVATQSVHWTTIALASAYSLGSGIPLLLIAYGGSRVLHSSQFLRAHTERIRQGFGVLMLLMAVAMAFHWDLVLQREVSRWMGPILIENNEVVREELNRLRGPMGGTNMDQVEPDTLGHFGPAPELVGIVNWINSPPLSLHQLRGKVVLIDFWTYSCINCLRTLPYLEKWYADYGSDGFVIIGVHTPEFEFEKDPKNVAEAVSQLGIRYPVAQDNNYETWNAYHNRSWPAHYLIDQNGELREAHFGEGAYMATENAIRSLLAMAPVEGSEPSVPQQRLTPETYLGTQRGHSYTRELTIQPGQIAAYHYGTPLGDDEVGLKGKWLVDVECITSESDTSYLELNFLAKEVYLVLTGSSHTPLEVMLDGQPAGSVHVNGDRKYDIASTTYGRHMLSLRVPQGVSAYAFTFGSE